MKNVFTSKEVVFFKTRKEARIYAVAAGKNTSAVIDAGTDKPVGARWGVLEVVEKAITATPTKTLTLKSRNTETMKASKWSRSGERDVTVTIKRSFL